MLKEVNIRTIHSCSKEINEGKEDEKLEKEGTAWAILERDR